LALMVFQIINPESLGAPRGYSNGLLTEAGGRLLFISGQVGWNERQEIISGDFVEQFDRALANLLVVVSEAGSTPADIARLVIYVTNIDEYRQRTREVGERYRNRMGKHFPAMVLVEVKGLLDDAAKVEIEGIALLNS
jgi:enamine deaminase RidA (YjgF/YER057c/UK114 family)